MLYVIRAYFIYCGFIGSVLQSSNDCFSMPFWIFLRLLLVLFPLMVNCSILFIHYCSIIVILPFWPVLHFHVEFDRDIILKINTLFKKIATNTQFYISAITFLSTICTTTDSSSNTLANKTPRCSCINKECNWLSVDFSCNSHYKRIAISNHFVK